MDLKALARAVVFLLVVAVFAGIGGAPSALASSRRVTLSPAYVPETLNGITVSPSAPVAFAGSHETDTLFAFDPRTGAEIGRLEVGDGPLYVRLFESGAKRTLAVTCDGVLGDPRNFVALVDASDPAHMAVVTRAYLPDGYLFLFGYATVRFTPDGGTIAVVASDEDTTQGVFLTFDVATGAERGHVETGFATTSAESVTAGGRTIMAIAQATTPRGRVTVVDYTNPAAPAVVTTAVLANGSAIFSSNTVSLAPDGRAGFIASLDGNALYAFDTTTGAVLSRTPTVLGPSYTTFFTRDGNPLLLVTSLKTGKILEFDVADPAAPHLTATVQSPSSYLENVPVISADGRAAYAATSDANRLFAVDLVEGRVTTIIGANARPVEAAVWEGPEGRFVSALAFDIRAIPIFKVGAAGFQPAGSFVGPADGVDFTLFQNIALSSDGRYAFAASKLTNELVAVDVEAGTIAGRISASSGPSQVAVADDARTGRRRVALLGTGDSAVTFVDATDPSHMEVTGSTPVDSASPFLLELATLIFAGDGSALFVADASQFVYAIDPASAEILGSVGTGFVPVTLAMREEAGHRRLAVLNAQSGSTSIAIVDATNPAAMTKTATYQAPRALAVALNNVPTFTADGRFVLVGASLSRVLLAIDAETGALVGTVGDTTSVFPVAFADGARQRIVAFNLGSTPAGFFKLRKSGSPKKTGSLDTPDGSYFVAGNNAVAGPNGVGLVPNYGRSSALLFDARTASATGEVPLGGAPGQVAVDWARGRVVALEVNGTASAILIADLADATAVAARAADIVAPSAQPARGANARAAAIGLRRAAGSTPSVDACPSHAARTTEPVTARIGRSVSWEPLSKRK